MPRTALILVIHVPFHVLLLSSLSICVNIADQKSEISSKRFGENHASSCAGQLKWEGSAT